MGPLLLNQKTLGSCLCQGQHVELEGALDIPPPSLGEEPESREGKSLGLCLTDILGKIPGYHTKAQCIHYLI